MITHKPRILFIATFPPPIHGSAVVSEQIRNSKVINDAFDGDGTNCKRYSRFIFDFDNSESKNFKFPPQIIMIPHLRKMALSYHSIPKRIWSRIMYMIYK